MEIREGKSVGFTSDSEINTVIISTRYFIDRLGEQDPYVGSLHDLVEAATSTAKAAEFADDISFYLSWNMGRVAMIAVDATAHMHPDQEVRDAAAGLVGLYLEERLLGEG